MSGVLVYAIIPLAVIAVVIVLGLGLVNLARGGSPRRAQALMQWRILLQGGVLLLVLALLWLSGR